MSNYKATRGAAWNYGGQQWKLSRSKIELYLNCPLCFYLDNKLGTKQPPGYPFTLNVAVDFLLKKEMDIHRVQGTRPEIAEGYGIAAVPFQHADLDIWRANFKGLAYTHPETGFCITGAVDDVWVKPNGDLLVVDYKATSKAGKIERLDEPWHRGYKRQMEIYQWLLRRKGFPVAEEGYFLYANADKSRPAFNARLDFELTLIAHRGEDGWIDDVLTAIKACLESPLRPEAGKTCDVCTYAVQRQVLLDCGILSSSTPEALRL